MLRQQIALLVIVPALSACAAKNLYVAHDTVIGVNGALNTNNGSGHLLVGYDRHFVGVIPKKGDSGEAMAVRACSTLKVKGIKLTRFDESLAIGAAALDGEKLKCQKEITQEAENEGS